MDCIGWWLAHKYICFRSYELQYIGIDIERMGGVCLLQFVEALIN